MKLPFFTLFLFVFASCSYVLSPKKLVVKHNDINKISDIDYFDSFSYISRIESGNTAKYNDSLSKVQPTIMAQVYAKSPAKLRLRKHIQLVDTTTKNKVELELHKLYSSTKILDNTSKLNLKTPFTIDSVLVANQSKYGIAVLVTGFDRSLGNIYGQTATGILIGVATLGTFYTYPIV